MDRDDDLAIAYRSGERNGSRPGQKKAAFKTCGSSYFEFEFANVVSVLPGHHNLTRPSFSHPSAKELTS
jgi:hypothetical protein